MEYKDWILKEPWFTNQVPLNPTKPKGILTISGVVSDGEKVVIGDTTYEFDNNNTITAGSVKIDMAGALPKATTTFTFTGDAIATETFILGTRVYEFSADGVTVTVPTNIPVDISGGVTGLPLLLAINAAVEGDADAVVTPQNGVIAPAVALEFWAKIGGTVGNNIASTETCTNASFTAVQLAGGLNTIVALDAILLLRIAINANDPITTASIGGSGELIATYDIVGTSGNTIPTTTTLVNGSWGAATLADGYYGTPCQEAFTIIQGNPAYYVCTIPGNKDDVKWQTFTLADY